MSKYILIIVWLGVMALVQMFMGCQREEKIFGVRELRTIPMFALIVLIPIAWMAANRGTMMDTYLYLINFRSMPSAIGEIGTFLPTVEKDKGFTALSIVIKSIFGSDEVIYLLVLAILQCAALCIVYRKYSESYLMSIFLFVASAIHVSWMMNGIRQFISTVIIFAATPLLLKRRYYAVIAVILFASMFHVTALLMLPIVFIVQGKAWNEKTVFYIVVSLMAMYVFDKYTGVMDFMLQGTEFEGSVANWQAMGDDGVNPIRVFVNAIPMLLAFLGRNHIKYENDNLLNICVNMSVITTGLYLVAMVTSGIMVGRLPIYTSLYNLILLPNLIPKMFTESSERMVRMLMIGFYMLYYIMEVGF